LLGREDELWRIALPAPHWNSSNAGARCRCRRTSAGGADHTDRERYQSIFAREPGARSQLPPPACTSTSRWLAALAERGVSRAQVTLHVGAGTFQPLRTESIAAHALHAERARVSAATCEAIRAHARLRRPCSGRGHHGDARARVAALAANGGAAPARRPGSLVRGHATVHHAGLFSFR